VIGTLQQRGHRVEPFHFRTNDRYEIDLVLEFGGERWAIEVKLSSAPSPGDMDRLDRTADMIDASRRVLVSQTRRVVDAGRRVSCNLPWLLRQFSAAGS
jgi:predicted AAA+ superfamily ATPase